MGTRTSYRPGAFCWVDLESPDAAVAAAFYSALFGWDAEETEDEYVTFRFAGDTVCGLRAGAQARWENWVTVDDADASAARAVAHGGTIVAAPFDAGMGLRRDPCRSTRCRLRAVATGIALRRRARQRRRLATCRIANDARVDTWHERARHRPRRARFYEHLFGWRTETVDTGPDGPPVVAGYNGETLNASFGVVADGPPHWRPYFTVPAVDTAIARVRELGSTLVFGPVPLPDGAMAVVLDPQGAVFGLFAGEVDP